MDEIVQILNDWIKKYKISTDDQNIMQNALNNFEGDSGEFDYSDQGQGQGGPDKGKGKGMDIMIGVAPAGGPNGGSQDQGYNSDQGNG